MSAKEQIGRLQGLLERVQMRAQEARASGAAFAPVAPAYATPEPASVEIEHESFPPDTAAGDELTAYGGADDDAELEVSSETVEVDIDIDEPMPMESGAQPVAQQTMPPEDLEEEVEERPMATDPSMRAPAHEEVVHAAAPANEIEEPAPSSSRRPIAGEEPAESYSEESAPRHTPPPESGKQVAAPSVHPVAARSGSEPSINPSAPPPSLEGHTLVGGWREPGLGVPQILPAAGAVVGVRVPPSPTQPAAAAPAQASGTRLTADVTRPELAASANVAQFEGAAPVARPTTLGEMLDLTLSL
ncbi:MAG TPA: hypothetical protein VLT33_46015 [Labilithrix sp.]|nr:hypothetical protein [Labilithrix sp.]